MPGPVPLPIRQALWKRHQQGASSTELAEACTAVNNAVHRINPKAKVNPGHSSDLKIFEEKT